MLECITHRVTAGIAHITLLIPLPWFSAGAVLECILAEIHGGRGDRVTAGVGRMMVRDKTPGAKKPMGGFAVEYEGHASEDVAQKQLDEALGRELI